MPALSTAAEPFLPPQVARLAGLMPLRSLGIEQFRLANPAADGRGVLIAILDGGIDAGVPGLQRTSTDEPKLIDLRDFSGEGRIALHRVVAEGDSVVVHGQVVHGVGRILRLTRGPLWAGELVERTLGRAPAADVNGDGDADDRFPIIVTRASDGWVLMADTDANGSLVGERVIRDFAVAGETFAYGPLTIAVNLAERENGDPILDLFFDTSGHGTHVAGIAAGHHLFGIPGFDGAAPGAQIIGLKIANNARGGVSVTGSMVAAMRYAASLAARRGQPLVLNLSYGVGNETEGWAVIDSLVNAFAIEHLEVLLVISAGNDGPGLSSVGFPGSAEFALTVCALFPGVFAEPPIPGSPPRADVMGWWSSRGGEVQKPDLCAPGVAFSNVPPWQTGEEVSGGTSMAAPQVSGAAALLQSALLTRNVRPARAIDLRAALMSTARPVAGATVIDAGTGIPDVAEAFRWLLAGHQPGRFRIRALADGGNQSRATAAFRRNGVAPGDTVQRFEVTSVDGQPTAEVVLAPDVPWLSAPARVAFRGGPATIPVQYQPAMMREPGLYVGTVWARSATNPVAGALFGLTSTVVVPYDLAEGIVRWQKRVPAGREGRLFVRVPVEAGGLQLTARVPDGQAATIALFEPSGRPQRDQLTVELSGPETEATVIVRAEDLVPGVWEVVVVAPPLSPATVAVVLEQPRVRLEHRTDGVELVNAEVRPMTVHLSARRLGVASHWSASGDRGPVDRRFATPAWASGVAVEVVLDPASWNWFTDFGSTVFDGEGRLLGTEPLHYATGRQWVPFDVVPEAVRVELFPALADTGTDRRWSSVVTVAFHGTPEPMQVLGGASDTTFVLEAGGRRRLTPQYTGEFPAGMELLMEVQVRADEVTTVRRSTTIVTAASAEAGR
ncbi:MAG: S8 family serine peptidase [Gemmatimonadales bacterium]